MRARIASGRGRYSDPWHPYELTSTRLADILAETGFEVAVDAVDEAMTRLDGVDLLVVDAGDPWRGSQADALPAEASVDGLDRALERGTGVLALHAAVSSLRDYPAWAPATGAVWIPGLSWHPPAGTTTVHVLASPAGPDPLAGLSDFDVVDERYLRLQRLGRSTVVAEFTHDGVRYPAAWVRTHGRSRIAVDVLGHGLPSYAAPGHRTLVQRLARWAAGAH
ncbi:ThuA domain-containing protein [Plantactinospora sp. CA-294935]|uniref:ThuA domain-containing protein n=1 Tax=Plantactinospora sp. CA-294935 TaxID=3240012 RepID=UPI003D8A2B8F